MGDLGGAGRAKVSHARYDPAIGVDICVNSNGGYYADLPTVDNFKFRYYTLGTYTNSSYSQASLVEQYPPSWPCYHMLGVIGQGGGG